MFLAGIGAAIPAYAADATPRLHVILAATGAAPTPAEQAKATEHHMARADERVEARISDLHTRLGITAAQEDSWSKVAQAMRDNANTMAALTQARSANAATMTAVDDLKSYAEIAQAHADGIQKFAPVFGALYDSMSDDQKRNADVIFRARSHSAMKHKSDKVG
ncbi:MAG: Spy/CpxP family protein refolding chaperone [Nevskia sp.]|nr:Spy/CpxP family protein refolding chaperone [Nevskia sp.]